MLPIPSPPGTPRLHRRRRSAAPRLLLAAVAGVVAVVAVTAAACGSEDGSGTATTQGPAPSDAVVRIVDGRFDPRTVEVAVGGSVTWVNDDLTEHLVVSLTPDVIGSPLIGKAGSYTREFDAAGEYRYYCSIHNEMKGTVVVR